MLNVLKINKRKEVLVMLEFILSIGFGGILVGGFAVAYGLFMVVISPIMYIVYKNTGGKENFISWFRKWKKDW